ncbi:glutamine synthetase [Candidatus Woesearchaeota archaeon]|nr:glutamine synthetase [Candidatus Woesearchaeota archaeon]
MDKNEALERVRKDEVEVIELQFTDLHGVLKSVDLPSSRLEESLERGTWFDGSSIEGFTRIQESDVYLRPDPSTYQTIPWNNDGDKSARFICDIFNPDGTHFEGDPRHILRRAVERAEKRGYTFNVGPELEFFLLPKEAATALVVPHDTAGYFDMGSRDLGVKIRREIVRYLREMGFEPEMSHHEVAPGQHEIDFKYGEALRQADRCLTFKYVVKSVAQDHDLVATFMPKPFEGLNGSGMHTHQSLFKGDKNEFYDENGQFYLSGIARRFIAGQLKHAGAMAAVVAPTVNSYKRLVPGYEAPVIISWGQKNRSTMIRIPQFFGGNTNSVRAELRFPDPSCNPYLAFAVMLEAGLDGMARRMKPAEPVEGSMYEPTSRSDIKYPTLPATLSEALRLLEQDPVLMKALGPHTGPLYVNAKRQELEEFNRAIHPWEHKMYLDR